MRNSLIASLLAGCVVAGTVLAQPEVILNSENATKENILKQLVPKRQITVEGDEPAAVSLLITFQTNSALLSPSALKSVDALGHALQSPLLATYKFAIEGHADPRGAFGHNMRLSQTRAQSVVDYLASNFQIARNRLKAIGKGSTELYNAAQPTAPENRRVTIKRLPAEGE